MQYGCHVISAQSAQPNQFRVRWYSLKTTEQRIDARAVVFCTPSRACSAVPTDVHLVWCRPDERPLPCCLVVTGRDVFARDANSP